MDGVARIRRAGRSGFLPGRTVHLHPLGRCNLRCLHCYSASSPTAAETIPAETLLALLPRLREEGYEIISLSGGEPLLYPELVRVSERARTLGFRVTAITNGFRVTPRHDALLDALDGVAVSFDGLRTVHDRVRDNPRAFDVGLSALRHLRDRGQAAAVAFTVSRESLPDLPRFVEIVAALGVRAVQLRPLVMTGRAVADYCGPALTPGDMTRLWLTYEALRLAWDGQLAISCDAVPTSAILAERSAWAVALTGRGRVLSDEINPLVITPGGRLRPYTYDFPAAYDLGRIEDLVADPGAVRSRMAALRPLLALAFDRLEGQSGVIDWFAWHTAMAARVPA